MKADDRQITGSRRTPHFSAPCRAPGHSAHGHALRHLHGSLLSQLDVSLAVAQAQLGHADPRITQICTHVPPGAQRDAVEVLERHLFPNCSRLHLLEGNAEYEGAGLS